MNTKIWATKIKLIVFILINIEWMWAQTPPPIRYVYDTIVLHDTIRIRKPKFKILSALPTKSCENGLQWMQSPATFLPKRILIANPSFLNLQKKTVQMKKNAFWAMLLWNLPNLLAQNQVNLSVGGGTYWLTSQSYNETYSSNPNAHFQVGLSVYRQAFGGRFNYGAGLDYHYLLASRYNAPLEVHPLWDPLYYFTMIQADYNRNFSTLSLPIYLQWNLKYVKPIIGIAYEYKQIPMKLKNLNEITIRPTIEYTEVGKFAAYTHKLSFWGGVEVPFSDTYSIRLNYVQEMLGNERVLQNVPSGLSNVKNYRIDLTFVAHLSELGCK